MLEPTCSLNDISDAKELPSTPPRLLKHQQAVYSFVSPSVCVKSSFCAYIWRCCRRLLALSTALMYVSWPHRRQRMSLILVLNKLGTTLPPWTLWGSDGGGPGIDSLSWATLLSSYFQVRREISTAVVNPIERSGRKPHSKGGSRPFRR
jgi:hypothetical protein